MGDPKLCPSIDAATLPSEPFAVQQMRAGEVCSHTGTAETLDRLEVETLGGVTLLSSARDRA